MTLSRFEFCLSFQINISCCEESFVNVCVHRADRHIQFRVICKDLIRGLPLLNQWRYNLVFLMELVLGHIYSRTRRYQQFTIFSVSSTAVVIVFMCNCAVIYLFVQPLQTYGALSNRLHRSFQSPCRSDYR